MKLESEENILIEGDNLIALSYLCQNYEGKIKLIYIDPPYNTGNNFEYKDNLKRRLNRVIEGEQTGISKKYNWIGGGKYSYIKL